MTSGLLDLGVLEWGWGRAAASFSLGRLLPVPWVPSQPGLFTATMANVLSLCLPPFPFLVPVLPVKTENVSAMFVTPHMGGQHQVPSPLGSEQEGPPQSPGTDWLSLKLLFLK